MNKELLEHFVIDSTSPTWLSFAYDIYFGKNGIIPAGTHAGRINDKGYPEVQFDKKFYAASRVVWAKRTGEWTDKRTTHIFCIDRDRSNLSEGNLIPVPQTVIRLLDNWDKNYPGYYWHQGGYLPHLQRNGKRIYFGQCDTPEEAHARYRTALAEEIKFHGYGFLL